VLPYTKGTTFDVADAYDTNGEVLTPAEAENQSSSSSNDWQKNLDEFTEKAKEGLKDFGKTVTDKSKELWNSLWGKIQENQ